MLRWLAEVYSDALRRVPIAAAIWLSVLTLAVLNPLACVLHCAITAHTQGHGPHASPLFLCQFPAADAPADAPALAAHGLPMAQAPLSGGIPPTPRPFYEMLATTVLAAVFFLMVSASAPVSPAVPPRRAIFPPVPPPRAAAPIC